MNAQFSIRPATSDDLSKVLSIEKQVYPYPWSEENFRQELDKPYSEFLLVTDDETDSQTAGYLVFWILFDECQILNLAIDLPYRGLGFAKLLVRKTAQIAYNKGIRKVVLEVRKSNLPALGLYQSLNFVITHIRKGFYQNGEDAYHMVLSLEEDLLQF